VPPEEAIDYFRRKRVVVRKEFDDLEAEARSAAFTVSGVYKKDILEAFKEEIAQALESGATQKDVVKGLKEILAGAGHRELGDFHLETIVRTNMQMAYGVGRRRALEETVDDLPFWEYHAVLDDRTRPAHAACDGLVLPANHPFWDEHFPPWAFNCRCSVTATTGIPAGYNKKNPSGQAVLAYDKSGVPVKAEYGTAVYDLSAGKFQGVPKQAGLRETIEQAVARSRERYQTPKEVLRAEDAIRFDTKETALFFDTEGKEILRAAGEADRIELDLTDEQASQLRGSVMTHNHPTEVKVKKSDPRWKGASFSTDDIKVAAELGLAEARAVTFGYRFSMRPPAGGWSEETVPEILASFERNRAKVARELMIAVRSGEMTVAEAEARVQHEVWKLVAAELGLKYRRSAK
jgi:SPP1 gp7 family putative phage head morphogenesis protein